MVPGAGGPRRVGEEATAQIDLISGSEQLRRVGLTALGT
jgi:hypothetical protein